jgi:hypothetical protein
VKRRDVLRQTSVILAALGISETGLLDWASRAQQALAQSSRRQLALLIGINTYPSAALSETQSALHGCLNDIDLQRELLIHRFGFSPSDILTLTNEQATRQGILAAIVHHLYEQVQPGDGVILHFSGYGSRLHLSSSDTWSRGWVPFDATLPTEASPIFTDLNESTLASLLKLLKTKQITTILDAGFSDLEVRLTASLKSRARAIPPTAEAWAENPDLTAFFEQVGKPEPPSHFPGLLLRAAAPELPVVERTWDGFSAGLFTYALTQYLWTVMPATTLQIVMGQTRNQVGQWMQRQVPQVAGQRAPEAEQPYDALTLMPETQADGAVVGVSADGSTADLWLGGLPPDVVQYCGGQSWVQVRAADGAGVTVQLRSQTGLHAKVKRPDNAAFPWQVGQRVYEAARLFPRAVHLVVALDNRLERIERVDATSALAALPFVSAIATEDHPADCLFGKPLDFPQETLTASLDPVPPPDPTMPMEPVKQGYGLFYPARTPIPGTLAKQDEAIKAAVSRLTPKLQSLLAIKLLRLTCNQVTSQLPARFNLEMLAPQEKLLLQQETPRSPVSLPKSRLAAALGKQPLPLEVARGSRIRYRLFNFSPEPIYFLLLNLDARDRLSIFFPPVTSTDPRDTNVMALQDQFTIAPGQSVTIPQTTLFWSIEAPLGKVETFAICSKAPFPDTLALLSPLASTSTSQRINLGENALTIIQSLLNDLHQGSRRSLSQAMDMYALEVGNWVTFSMQYQTV